MSRANKLRLAGALGGLVNGMFGGGGGMLLLPLLGRWGALRPKSLFANSVAIIFPICLVSAAVYFFHAQLSWAPAWPYLLGGVGGGLIGGLTFEKVAVKWLKMLFGLFLL